LATALLNLKCFFFFLNIFFWLIFFSSLARPLPSRWCQWHGRGLAQLEKKEKFKIEGKKLKEIFF
jgi:hypothetical protein